MVVAPARVALALLLALPPGLTQSLYDPNGHLATLTDANTHVTTYRYDDYDRLDRTTYANGSHDDYAYDAASNLTLRTPPAGQAIRYERPVPC